MQPPQDSARNGSFFSTPWSLLFTAAQISHPTQAQEAVSRLCQIYRRPIFDFVCAQGYRWHEAQDLTQGFLIHLIQGNRFAQADRAKGSFRSYVIGALKFFLAHARREQQAKKRGEGIALLPLDEAIVEQARALEESELPGDREWAGTILDHSKALLANEYDASGKGGLYSALLPHLSCEKGRGSSEETARQLGCTPEAMRTNLSRMRIRLRELVIETLRAQIPPGGNLADELSDFRRILGP